MERVVSELDVSEEEVEVDAQATRCGVHTGRKVHRCTSRQLTVKLKAGGVLYILL